LGKITVINLALDFGELVKVALKRGTGKGADRWEKWKGG
jgi:hypothetical protein